MISKSKLLWDSRWPTWELELFTSVREILRVILKYDKRLPYWFICPIQSHSDISYMSYHRLSWLTLSFVEWWVCWRRGTCHLPVFLLCGSLLASKCLVRQLPTPGIVIHFHLDSSTQEGHGVIFLKREREKERKKKCPWSLAKIVQKRSSIKWPKNISKSVSPFLPLHWTFVTPQDRNLIKYLPLANHSSAWQHR